jgi:hypothetical protein
VSGRLSSPRVRRRLAWGGALIGVTTGIVVLAVSVGNTGKSFETPVDPNGKAWVSTEPQSVTLSAKDRRSVLQTTTRFISTAVVRKHLDSAWNLLGPEMKAGQTRAGFETGDNNVVPFDAVAIATWDVLYSYRDDVGLDVALVGSPKGNWAGKTFTIELKRYPADPGKWLVASWAPRGIGGSGQMRDYAKQFPAATVRSPLSARWLLAPVGLVGAFAIGLIGWGILSRIRYRRAMRRYESLLGHRGSGPV